MSIRVRPRSNEQVSLVVKVLGMIEVYSFLRATSKLLEHSMLCPRAWDSVRDTGLSPRHALTVSETERESRMG